MAKKVQPSKPDIPAKPKTMTVKLLRAYHPAGQAKIISSAGGDETRLHPGSVVTLPYGEAVSAIANGIATAEE